jgi:epoxyqueuosine reductase
MTARMERRLSELDFAPKWALAAIFPYPASRTPGSVALYARVPDYVAANLERLRRAADLLKILRPGGSFHPSGNAYPLPAVQAARMAGLGDIGAHGLLITEEYGSFVTIGAVLTDIELQAGVQGGYCGRCGRCVRSCPTGALSLTGGERAFIKERCVAYITKLKERTPPQEELLRSLGAVVGCDICQLACPRNAAVLDAAAPSSAIL